MSVEYQILFFIQMWYVVHIKDFLFVVEFALAGSGDVIKRLFKKKFFVHVSKSLIRTVFLSFHPY